VSVFVYIARGEWVFPEISGLVSLLIQVLIFLENAQMHSFLLCSSLVLPSSQNQKHNIVPFPRLAFRFSILASRFSEANQSRAPRRGAWTCLVASSPVNYIVREDAHEDLSNTDSKNPLQSVCGWCVPDSTHPDGESDWLRNLSLRRLKAWLEESSLGS
jgi:hypothetical protein